ncbi:MAG: hypothetical protein DCC56_06050 [Anaerolineae bacterium]|nr:MAG: hypothetical protein DCC56_06050 [Anaerolineae bacterium]WKZ43584.1 MAG: hypothetical protein QY302_15930 [Anaerolineales bacterium]
MARRPGKKYPLVVYRLLLSRWWPPMLAIGLVMLLIAYSEYIALGQFLPWRWLLPAAVGILGIFVGILFFIFRYLAYVQPYPDHLKLITPFLRLNISYKRIVRTTTTEMRLLFNFRPKGLGAWLDILGLNERDAPLATKTALVVDLKNYPIPRQVLEFFLSRYFFKDKTPHLVLLVDDWMRFSSEMESMRTRLDPQPASRRPSDSILSRLSRK